MTTVPTLSAPSSAQSQRSDRLGIVLALVSVLGFAHKGIFFKWLYADGLSGLQIGSLRMVASFPVVAIAYLVFLRRQGSAAWPQFNRRRLAVYAVSGLIIVGPALIHTLAFEVMAANVTGVLIFVYPAFLLVGRATWQRRPVTQQEWIQGAAVVAAVAILVGPVLQWDDQTAYGMALTMVAAVVWAINTAFTGWALSGKAAGPIAALELAFFAALPQLAVSLSALASDPIDLATILNLPLFGAKVAGMGLVATALPAVGWFVSIQLLGAVRPSLLAAFNPVVTCVLAALYLGEDVTLPHAVAVALLTVSMLVPKKGLGPLLNRIRCAYRVRRPRSPAAPVG